MGKVKLNGFLINTLSWFTPLENDYWACGEGLDHPGSTKGLNTSHLGEVQHSGAAAGNAGGCRAEPSVCDSHLDNYDLTRMPCSLLAACSLHSVGEAPQLRSLNSSCTQRTWWVLNSPSTFRFKLDSACPVTSEKCFAVGKTKRKCLFLSALTSCENKDEFKFSLPVSCCSSPSKDTIPLLLRMPDKSLQTCYGMEAVTGPGLSGVYMDRPQKTAGHKRRSWTWERTRVRSWWKLQIAPWETVRFHRWGGKRYWYENLWKGKGKEIGQKNRTSWLVSTVAKEKWFGYSSVAPQHFTRSTKRINPSGWKIPSCQECSLN